MKKRSILAAAAGLLVASLLAACGGNDDPVRVGLVTGSGSIDDRSYNATLWKGIQDAQRDLGVEGTYREPQNASEYAPAIQSLLDSGHALVIAADSSVSAVARTVAQAHPDRQFVFIDTFLEPALPNTVGVTFRSDEAGLLAGYLAAGMSRTGKVATFGGLAIPSVTMHMVGLEAGVARYAQQKGKNVQLLGWQTDLAANGCGTGRFAGGFNDRQAGSDLASEQLDAGADILVPIAGGTGLGAAAVAKARGAWVIGVDSDQALTAPEYREIYLSSILKNSDRVVYGLIQSLVAGRFTGGNQVGNLANGGVGLAPLYGFDATVPAALKAELAQLQRDIVDGKVTSGWDRCANR